MSGTKHLQLVANGRPRPLARAELEALTAPFRREREARRQRRAALASTWRFLERHGFGWLIGAGILTAAVTFAALALFAAGAWR